METQKLSFERVLSRIEAGPSASAGAIGHVRDVAKVAGLSRPEGERLRLVVEEITANIDMHGNAPAGSVITLISEPAENEGDSAIIRLTIRDFGIAFDPRHDLEGDDRTNELEDRGVGGLGWPLILELCDIESYERTPAGENILSLLIRL